MKTTIVEGVLTSYELVLAILFRPQYPVALTQSRVLSRAGSSCTTNKARSDSSSNSGSLLGVEDAVMSWMML